MPYNILIAEEIVYKTKTLYSTQFKYLLSVIHTKHQARNWGCEGNKDPDSVLHGFRDYRERQDNRHSQVGV